MRTLRKLEHVLEPVDDLEAPILGELPDVTSVKEALAVCSKETDPHKHPVTDLFSFRCIF